MIKKYQLKNGLKVLLVENHKSPVLSIQMWVKTGSADERKGEEGISHFIEHLVFKGTRKFKVGEIAASVEAAGGELNAYTSFDQTVFYVTISKEFESVGLDVIAEMMGYPEFVESEIDNERGVVIEEIKRSNDSPHRQASRLLFSTLYTKHPYGVPVIGFEENINKVSRKTLTDYFHSRYNPKTMTLVVAGDFKPVEMKKKIAANFSSFSLNKLRVVKRKQDTRRKHPALVVKEAPFEETIAHVAFPTPQASHKDIAALEVLALIFGQGESSRLNQRLRLHSHLVNFANSSVFVARDPGFLAISLSLNQSDFVSAMNELLEEMKGILETPPSLAEFKKALTNLASEQYYYLETVDGLARKYGHYEDLFGDYGYFERFMKQVQNLTPTDIRKAARKYLKPSSASLVIMAPSGKQSIEPVARKWLKDFAKIVKTQSASGSALKLKDKNAGGGKKDKQARVGKTAWVFKKPSREASSGVEKWTLANGISVIVKPNFDTPVISLRCASLSGSRSETSSNHGGTELLSRVWVAGAGPYDELTINSRIDEMAAGLSAFGGRNSIGLSMTCLKPFLPEMLDMYFYALTEPHFEATAIKRELKSMQEHLKLRKDNPGEICVLEFMKALFGNHPYGRDPYPSESEIEKLSRSAVEAIFQNKAGLTLVAAGAIDASELKKQIEARLGKSKINGENFKHAEVDFPTRETLVQRKSVKQQSHIILGFPGLTLKDPDRYALQVLQAILAGQGGRLFLELRDKASLAYSVAPMRMEGLDCGYFGAYIGCSPEKSATAIKMMRQEFAKLVETSVDHEELTRAQRYLIGKHDIELQKNSNIASAILFDHIYGIDFLETYRYAERIRSVSSEDVTKIARRLFSKPAVISYVGPETSGL